MVDNNKTDTLQEEERKLAEEKGLRVIKYSMLGIGALSFIIGLIRQWPVLGKGYDSFIEGKGYMALVMGLIIMVLGVSVKLFIVDDEEQ